MSSTLRPTTILLFCSLAAGVGAASGSLVDTSPLRWGSDLRDLVSQEEHPARVAKRMHDTFERARRLRHVEAGDYLAEDDVIVIEPIEATAERKRTLAMQDRQRAVGDAEPPEIIEMAAKAELRQPDVYEEQPMVAGSAEGIAGDVAGVKVIRFPSAKEKAPQAAHTDWRSASVAQPDRSARTE